VKHLQSGLIELHLIKPRSYQMHKCYPERFKAAVRMLLMCVWKGVPTAGLTDVPD